jgi:ATP-binding cassette subfamily B protein
MVAKYYGKSYTLEKLREKSSITRKGVSMLGISDAAESIGFRTLGVKLTYAQLMKEAILPCIAHWQQRHFIVVYKVEKNRVWVADPGHGLVKYTRREFMQGWVQDEVDGEEQGLCLLLETTPAFYSKNDEKRDRSKFSFLFRYLRPYRKFIVQLFAGLLLGSILQLIFPFLTQAIVDKGIGNHDLGFIYLVLIAQLTLFLSQTAVEFIRGWISLHISTRVNLSLISDFLIKLLKLSIGFFDTKMIGDIMQRIRDHSRVESFLTGSIINIIFSCISLVVFSIVLAMYHIPILIVFLIGSTAYAGWVILFWKRRRDIDFKRFSLLSENQSNLYQLITGIQEIKLNNCEKQKRWEWERIQARLFKTSVKGLSLNQMQTAGSSFINQLKNILISFISAKAVIDGDMTLGMMMAVQYIIGQLNAPIQQLINLSHSAQDAKISLERLSEIHDQPDEEPAEKQGTYHLPADRSISAVNLSFQYEGPHSEFVLKNLNITIPARKVTAIVGVSGSGKTTLVKLMLGFYPPTEGKIRIGNLNLSDMSPSRWREACGVVMQEGFIFSDSIARNIALSDEIVDQERLLHAAGMANIDAFVEKLPLGFNTEIGMEGHGLSQGQKQRILIARSIYKNPDYIFFDEATNSLDANNERIIVRNLGEFFKGRTVVIVAHRLSTVKNADQIVVLDKGMIVESGTHAELVSSKGAYYRLVKDQLELGA